MRGWLADMPSEKRERISPEWSITVSEPASGASGNRFAVATYIFTTLQPENVEFVEQLDFPGLEPYRNNVMHYLDRPGERKALVDRHNITVITEELTETQAAHRSWRSSFDSSSSDTPIPVTSAQNSGPKPNSVSSDTATTNASNGPRRSGPLVTAVNA